MRLVPRCSPALAVLFPLFLIAGCGGDAGSPAAQSAGLAPKLAAAMGMAPAGQGTIAGTVQGLDGAPAIVTVGNDSVLRNVQVDAAGRFSVTGLPDGTYFVKAEAEGYTLSQPQKVVLGVDMQRPPAREPAVLPAPADQVVFLAARAGTGAFHYQWTGDASVGGYEQTVQPVKPPAPVFLDEPVAPADSGAAVALQRDYNVLLSNEGAAWPQEYAARLLAIMAAIPQPVRTAGGTGGPTASKWVLSDSFLASDIAIRHADGGDVVTLSSAVFAYATPKMVLLDGMRGRFFSQRLHHALVRYVTAEGTREDAVDRILGERFGVSVRVPDYAALTAGTTGETADRFARFRPEEMVSLINMFEEMPEGFHKIKGLRHLVRRAYGQPNPRYPSVPAVAWTHAGYIEFMDSAFTNAHATHRLIVHEKSHFLWAFLFDDATRNDWAAVGGWYRDPTADSGWSTTQTTQFVSAYAHLKDPNEDMAESMADYILNPDLLRSRAPLKYAFVRDRVMHGDAYLSRIRGDLTFQVYNLFPDYEYPGKIRRVDVGVAGAATQDKQVTVEIELTAGDARFPGAKNAYMRMHSSIGTYVDVYLYPKNAEGTVLAGSFMLSKYSKNGYWAPEQIILTDAVGNQRFQGKRDFGWRLYIDNPLEVVSRPGYVPGSLTMQQQPMAGRDGHTLQKVVVTWQVTPRPGMTRYLVYAALTNAQSGARAYEMYGTYDPDTRTARVEFELSEYFPSGVYGIPYIAMYDEAQNYQGYYFSNQAGDEPLRTVVFNGANPDVSGPQLDLNRISVTATPTNASAPDGETQVSIVYYARDDKSGLGIVNFRLRDPQGLSHFDYHYHANTYTQFFEGDPRAWTRYEIRVLLPRGSPPGTWGLQEMTLYDKVGNASTSDFTETLHFTVAQK